MTAAWMLTLALAAGGALATLSLGATGAQDPPAEQPAQAADLTWTEVRELLRAAQVARGAGEHGAARRDLLAALETALAQAPQDDPRDAHTLLNALGNLARELGEPQAAERSHRAALAVCERTLGEEDPTRTSQQYSLGLALLELGRAREALEHVDAALEVRTRTLQADDPNLLRARALKAYALNALGDLRGALALEQAIVETYERTTEAGDPLLLDARYNLASTQFQLGDYAGAGRTYEALLEVYEADPSRAPSSSANVLHALGLTRSRQGDYGAAREHMEASIASHAATLPADHPTLQRVRQDLGSVLQRLGDLEGARRINAEVLAGLERSLPEEHAQLQRARLTQAHLAQTLGDLVGARELLEGIVAVHARTLPPGNEDRLNALLALAGVHRLLEENARARELLDGVLEVMERTRPPEDELLHSARLQLAILLEDQGDFERAQQLAEGSVEVYTRTRPPDDGQLQKARVILASILGEQGDLRGARRLEEQVLAALERSLPSDNPEVLRVRVRLASTLYQMGDVQGARAIQERALADCERTRPPGDRYLQAARQNLALSLKALGDLEGCRALEEQVLEAYARELAPEHPDLLLARSNLAATLGRLGDLRGARAQHEAVLAIREQTLSHDDPALQDSRHHLSAMLYSLGELERSGTLMETVLEVHGRLLPPGHRDVQGAQRGLALILAARIAQAPHAETVAADRARCAELLMSLGRAQVDEARSILLSSSAREAEEFCARPVEGLHTLLSFAEGYGLIEPLPGLEALAFELSEITRGAGLAAAELQRAARDRPEYGPLRSEVRAAGARIAELARTGGDREQFHAARARRERAERGLMDLSSELHGGNAGLDLDPARLASRLQADEALVAFRRYERRSVRRVAPGESADGMQLPASKEEHLCAFVLRREPEGDAPRLEVVLLGPLAPIELAVRDWRAAIGVDRAELLAMRGGEGPRTRGLGLAPESAEPERGRAAGEELRRLVWDPLVPALGDAARVSAVLDGVLHLCALDALPLAEGDDALGDRWRIETRVAAWELARERAALAPGGVLVALGGVEYGSAHSAREGALAAEGRAGSDAEFSFLPLANTEPEARGVAKLFERSEEADSAPIVLTGERATRAALEELAPQARYLHVATHGWFSPDAVVEFAGLSEGRGAALASSASAVELVRGLSPMVLCGLALAGANLPPDDLGRAPGRMTAEELSTLDLSRCELAVLSACDTSLGEGKAGQGLASLQKALHQAGARSVVTSLWKVPDGATAELMLDFYRRVRIEGEPKAQALWAAKRSLRDARDEASRPLYSPRDWAAWVLTGEPD